MSYLALYRKYRPDNFDDIVGQDYIIRTLKNEIINNKISHAYLFYGPRGTGKTTMAKTIAKLINCNDLEGYLPCDKCNSCTLFNNKSNPDIIEIDAASNNGVEEIRTIRENVSLMPSVSKYKVYIIDEVHMLSSGAFNALLKTLEEPPKHVIFILATTEFYKVPETIVSRCQTFQFERISENEIVNKLKFISSNENINVDQKVLELIAKHSNGGLRDSISMLDKLASAFSNITVENYYQLRGIANDDEFNDFISKILDGDSSGTFKSIEKMLKNGKNLFLLNEKLIEFFMDYIIVDNIDRISNDICYKILDILCEAQIDAKMLNNPNIVLEVAILKVIRLIKNDNDDDKKIISREIILEKKCSDNTKKETKLVKKEENVNKIDEKVKNIINLRNDKVNNIRVNNAFATANKEKLEKLRILWVGFSDYITHAEFFNVASYLIDGDLRVVGDNDVIISVKFDSIFENAYKDMDKLTELFSIVMKDNYNIAIVSEEEWDVLKQKYIEDKKNGIVYKLQNENEIVEKEDVITEVMTDKTYSSVVNDALTLFGDDLVEIK